MPGDVSRGRASGLDGHDAGLKRVTSRGSRRFGFSFKVGIFDARLGSSFVRGEARQLRRVADRVGQVLLIVVVGSGFHRVTGFHCFPDRFEGGGHVPVVRGPICSVLLVKAGGLVYRWPERVRIDHGHFAVVQVSELRVRGG